MNRTIVTAILAVMRYSITDTEQDGEVISSISLSPSAPSAQESSRKLARVPSGYKNLGFG